MRAVVDTNIVVRAGPGAAAEGPARAMLRGLVAEGVELCIAGQTLVEAWAVMTRPAGTNGLGFDTERARRELDHVLRAYRVLEEPGDLSRRWLDICTARRVVGRQAFDARIAALMISHGIRRLVTMNPVDFGRYPEIELLVPA